MPFSIPKAGLIITADDYGISDSVNQGTLEAVRKGIVTSVHVMANLVTETAMEELKDTIIESGNRCGIGLHLNTTWGKAIIQKPASFKHSFDLSPMGDAGDYFVYRMLNTYEHNQTDFIEMKNELVAQYVRLGDLLNGDFPIDAISSHHNIHFWDADFLKIIKHIASDQKIPVRSPIRLTTDDQRPKPEDYPKKTKPLARIALKNLEGVSGGTLKLLLTAICAEKLHEHHNVLTEVYKLPAPKNNTGHWFGQPEWYAMEWFMHELNRLHMLSPGYVSEIYMHLSNSPDEGDHRWDYTMQNRFDEFSVISKASFIQKFNSEKERLSIRHGSYRDLLQG
jgi:predicted glycoside hydrolase/deacetylase ChbG (UPF0249 family)